MKQEPVNMLEAFQLLKLGLAEMAQSWRDTTLTDLPGVQRALASATAAVREKQEITEALFVGLRARLHAVHALISEAGTALLALEHIDTRHIPADQIRMIMEARAALRATLRKAREVFAADRET
jgi:chromosome condensin MukBEF ATPase and DNA-binding subunit MukB